MLQNKLYRLIRATALGAVVLCWLLPKSCSRKETSQGDQVGIWSNPLSQALSGAAHHSDYKHSTNAQPLHHLLLVWKAAKLFFRNSNC